MHHFSGAMFVFREDNWRKNPWWCELIQEIDKVDNWKAIVFLYSTMIKYDKMIIPSLKRT